MSVSLCMIVKNEGETLKETLASTLPFVDEYVIGVDDKSADDTLAVAQDFARGCGVAADVHTFTWENDFSAARNAVIERASGDFIFTLDGHEKVIAGHNKIRYVAAHPQGCEVFAVEVQSTKAGFRTSFFQERLFLRKYRYHNACHNVLVFDPAVGARLSGVVMEHDRSDELAEVRKAQRNEMNIPPLLDRIAAGDRRAKAQLPQEYMSLRRWGDAVTAIDDYLTEEMEDRERYQVLIKKAMCCFWNGDTDGAEKALLAASGYNADKRNAHLVFLGDLYAMQGRVGAAMAMFSTALGYRKPKYFWFLYPQFYHEYPQQKLRRLNDQYKPESVCQAAH